MARKNYDRRERMSTTEDMEDILIDTAEAEEHYNDKERRRDRWEKKQGGRTRHKKRWDDDYDDYGDY